MTTDYLLAGRVLNKEPQELVVRAGRHLPFFHGKFKARPALGRGAFLKTHGRADGVPVNLYMMS